jgi:poly-gamma-glutamate capsule biosynthesis protein CapA/YwtB (metallophosphatase superfamily)
MRKIILLFLFFTLIKVLYSQSTKDSLLHKGPVQQESDEKPVTIIGTGDIMLGTNFPSEAYLPPGNNCQKLLEQVKDSILDADLTFGNLEGAFSDNLQVTKRCNDPSLCYAFRSPDKYFQCIVDAGYDLLSLANNHSGDLGAKGRENTIRLIESAGLFHAGLLSHQYTIFERDSLNFGFCAFSPNNGTCRINNIPEAQKIVRSLEDSCDIVIVSFHGGAEGRKHQHVTRQTEMYYGEDRGNVYDFAHKVIDAGADIVFGHGPHVVRAVEVYKERFIAYSLGNFCTYSRMNLSGPNGIAPVIKVYADRKGEFQKAKIIPAIQVEGKGTFLDPSSRAIAKIRELTKADFPEANIEISNEGWITKEK